MTCPFVNHVDRPNVAQRKTRKVAARRRDDQSLRSECWLVGFVLNLTLFDCEDRAGNRTRGSCDNDARSLQLTKYAGKSSLSVGLSTRLDGERDVSQSSRRRCR